jgi:6-phosphofructokinase 1
MDGLLYLGGTILGTSNKGRFSGKSGHGETRQIDPAVLAEARAGFASLGLRALVVVGGDGSLTIAQQCFDAGIPVVGVPKTIDNDIAGTVVTFGFDSAVAFATDALDRLRSTAQSHDRVMVGEVMGRYAGWIAAHAGIAGGADVILIPEIPFHLEAICQVVTEREAQGKRFTLVVVAEGAREAGHDFVTVGETGAIREARLGGIGAVVAGEIERRTGKETASVSSGTCSAAARPPPSTACCARALGSAPSASSPRKNSASWSPTARPTPTPFPSPRPSAACAPCPSTATFSARAAPSASASGICQPRPPEPPAVSAPSDSAVDSSPTLRRPGAPPAVPRPSAKDAPA